VFRDLVAGTGPEHFVATDLPLLARYAEAVALAEQAERELHKRGPVMPDGRVNPWNTVLEKAGRSVVALSMRLRLSPQSRSDPKTVSRRANGPKPSAYELMDDE
jgi:phage terminase small subunit